MKYLPYILLLFLPLMAGSCTDDPITEEPGSKPEFNIDKFSEGYSIAFDVTFDQLGSATRADDDYMDVVLHEWENYLDPEEFRVLFFDIHDRFLFESKSRWLTQVDSKDGGNRWRVGIPVFQYLGDLYDDTPGHEGEKLDDDDRYNWDRIVEIMRKEGFKIAVLANRPLKIMLPDLDDYAERYKSLKDMDFAKLGPFWTSKNSIATDDIDNSDVATVFDLHHCQFDPVYFSKSIGKSSSDEYGARWYDFIMDYNNHTEEVPLKNGEKVTINNAPWMGAASSWISLKRTRNVGEGDDKRNIRYYRLPDGRIYSNSDHYDDQENPNLNNWNKQSYQAPTDDPQYIPMYGIQEYAPLSTWVKGTTFNLSEQTGSQTGDYHYTTLSLLRSVVKLELRIPKKDKNGNTVTIDNKWAQLWYNNYMARCEPMDVSTPTRDIWKKDHENDCEWLRIRDYGIFFNHSDFKNWLAWYYKIWQTKGGWNFTEHGFTPNITSTLDPPQIFNPMTQRLQTTLISDCYLPTEDFHRWVIYCGERNLSDPSELGDMRAKLTISFFRIPVIIESGSGYNKTQTKYAYNIPIVNYSAPNNPIRNKYQEKGTHLVETITDDSEYQYMAGNPNTMAAYYDEVKANGTTKDFLPYPLLRNHFYRIEISYGDNADINVKIINADQRNVGGIVFN
ncbi:MAG: hypothetical protein J1F38_09650 [Muribaculaceae bacterium]|nr:hypothetical protein [Muribaculaceae bacterium]